MTAVAQLSSPPISPAQRRALFAWARAHGRTIDDLRAMTPAGSISMLTRDQARALLDRLNYGNRGGTGVSPVNHHPPRRRPRRPANVIGLMSGEQLKLLCDLRRAVSDRFGWCESKLDEWLAKRHFEDGRPMTMDNTRTSREATAVIQLLRMVLRNANRQRSAAHAADD